MTKYKTLNYPLMSHYSLFRKEYTIWPFWKWVHIRDFNNKESLNQYLHCLQSSKVVTNFYNEYGEEIIDYGW